MINRYFISGGSSGIPRSIEYNTLAWHQIILDTAHVMNEFGVRNREIVLIAQPSFPWDIGSVFAEACALCGADVICYGLMAGQEGMLNRWKDMRPQYIVAPSSLLLKLLAKDFIIQPELSLIAVGEPLSKESELKIKNKWHPKEIRRIYGLSGLGTLAYQFDPSSIRFCTNPRFRYFVSHGDENELQTSGVGRLIIQSKYDKTFIDTDDRVRLLDAEPQIALWNGEPVIELLGREGISLLLNDGTQIHDEVIQSLKNDLLLAELQCEYVVDDENECLIFRVIEGSQTLNKNMFLARLTSLVPELELEDGKSQYGIQIHVIISEIKDFTISARGKVLSLVQVRL